MKNSYDADIIIAGAGPAGAAFARALPDNLSAILLDRRAAAPRAFPYKPCGGLIAPDAQACLFHLGLTVPVDVLAGPQIFGVRAVDLSTGQERTFQRHYLNIDRERLDRWLISLAAEKSNVTLLQGQSLAGFEQENSGVTVRLGNGKTLRARFLAGADGASSRVRAQLEQTARREKTAENNLARGGMGQAARRLFCSLSQPKRYLAVQQWFEPAAMPPEFGAFFHPSITDYYGWTIPKDGRLMVGGALPWPGSDDAPDGADKKRGKAAWAEPFSLLIKALEQRGLCLGAPVHTESCALLRPAPLQSFSPGSGLTALLGEAACLVSPSSAEGLSYALRSAMSLAKAIHAGKSPHEALSHGLVARYAANLSGLILDLRLKSLKAFGMYTPLLRRLALASGFGAFSAKSLW